MIFEILKSGSYEVFKGRFFEWELIKRSDDYPTLSFVAVWIDPGLLADFPLMGWNPELVRCKVEFEGVLARSIP